ncbi:hypothetical protein V6N11_078262 [Hibiscus sabdariffa]|uniref:Uncharacterized protein n=1 Tax=Hibiscus sabdariffa TaxID=183260 RepID=A0ABR2TFS4_9ROSI
MNWMAVDMSSELVSYSITEPSSPGSAIVSVSCWNLTAPGTIVAEAYGIVSISCWNLTARVRGTRISE